MLTNPAPRLVVLSGGPQKPSGEAAPTGLAARLVGRGFAVLEIQKFSWHEVPDQFANFYTAYNRTKVQEAFKYEWGAKDRVNFRLHLTNRRDAGQPA